MGNKTKKLCRECAERSGLYENGQLHLDIGLPSTAGTGTSLDDTAHENWDIDKALKEIDEQKDAQQSKLKCPNCGLTEDEFEGANGMGPLGCEECYKAFGALIKPLLSEFHRGTKHCEATPADVPGEKYQPDRQSVIRIAELHEEMARAIAAEAYEDAANIRDRIKNLRHTQRNKADTDEQ